MNNRSLVALLVVSAGLFLWVTRNDVTSSPLPEVLVTAPAKRDVRAEYLKRLHVEDRREIAPGQTLTVVLVPDSTLPHMAVLDKRCVIYEHQEFRTAQMYCNGEHVGTLSPDLMRD